MKDFLGQINAAVGAGLFYVALHSALALPDICAALESPSGTTSGERYADWFDRFVANKYTVGPNKEPSLTGDQCYQFRCALLHQGRLQPDRAQGYSRMFFLEPNGGLIMHNNVMGDALNIDVRIFCGDLIAGALAWLTTVEGTEPYQTNSGKSVQRYANGIEPWVSGVPAIG